MKVLITAASKHGSTTEIAERIGGVLAGRRIDTTVAAPQDVETVEEYDAFVVGSGVYVGSWLAEAREFIEQHADVLRSRPVWLFSSGPIGDPPLPEEPPVDAEKLVEATSAREHRVFAGKLDRKRLGFAEKAVTIALRAPEGDFRNWDAIERWASQIADELLKKS